MSHTFPQEVYKQLDGIDFRLLNEIAFLSKQQQRRTGSAYCCPGREYLAARVGCDIWTISRHTTKLEKLGLIIKRQRRPIRGIYQTCLYKLVKWASWALASIAGQLRKGGSNLKRTKAKDQPQTHDNKSHRVRQDTHKVSENRNKNTETGKSSILDPLIANILEKWKARGPKTS